jgi:hypothetical protein
MNQAQFTSAVNALPFGKRLPDAVYVHVSTLLDVPDVIEDAVTEAASLAKASSFDLIKLGRKKPTISLLRYPEFWSDPFPAISDAWTVDLAARTAKHTRWKLGDSTPILHRKESFLLPSDPNVPALTAVTRDLERRGLFDSTSSIGIRGVWEYLLREAGVKVVGQKVVEIGAPARRACPDVGDSRATSRPIVPKLHKALLKAGFWQPGDVNFDLGGGKYDAATKELEVAGVVNQVWDPNRPKGHNDAVMAFFEANPPRTITVANVLNVICESEMRQSVIGLAAKMLAPGGVVAFQIFEGNKSGYGWKTPDGWQENRRAVLYTKEIERWFKSVKRAGAFFFASDPRPKPRGDVPPDGPTAEYVSSPKVPKRR